MKWVGMDADAADADALLLSTNKNLENVFSVITPKNSRFRLPLVKLLSRALRKLNHTFLWRYIYFYAYV